MSFLENTRDPSGFGGKIMVTMMNLGHSSLTSWGLKFLDVSPDGRVLDCGCGGGAAIEKLLRKCPKGIVKGIDNSPISVEKARKRNHRAITEGRCVVWQGSVEQIIFASGWFDGVTAFETVYFWQNLPQCFREVYRVLKPGGTFLICNECGDAVSGERWSKRIDGMTIYSDVQLRAFLEQTGFRKVEIHSNHRGWLCVTGQKKE